MGDPDGTITNWVINGSMSRAQRSISDPFSDQLFPTNGQGKLIVTFELLDIFEKFIACGICNDNSLFVISEELEEQPIPMPFNQHQNVSDERQLGFLDRISILLNSECQNHFHQQNRLSEEYGSTFDIAPSGFNNQNFSDSSTYINNSTITSTTIRDAATTNNNSTRNLYDFHNDSDFTNMAVEDIFFHLANIFFLISYLAPPTRFGQVCLHSGLCIGFLLFATWAWNIVCAPDVFVWYFAFLVFNAGQLLYILYQV